ncbi:MAG: hypothetical protein LBC28_00715 [Oscillospiraceae bacterium]|jgi:hypothetical protein|nr:hypothetical protein [Oscillospiraceae bacterium]
MGIINEVKCSKCDRRYSAVRARCPYCGARRGGRGKLAGGSDNTKAQLGVGIIILLALIATVAVLLITSADTEIPEGTATPPGDITPNFPNSDSNTTIEDPNETPLPETPEPPVETPAPALESVAIMYNNVVKTDFTEPAGKTLTFTVKLVPEGLDLVPEWSSSNPEVFDVVPTDTTGLTVKVTLIRRGEQAEKLTVRVGDKTAECIVRVR